MRSKPLNTSPKIPLTSGPRDAYGNSFAAVVTCSCGHQAQLPHDPWVKLATGYGVELARARARLRCRVCGRRGARIEVYRVSS
jgi:hypothetical protein